MSRSAWVVSITAASAATMLVLSVSGCAPAPPDPSAEADAVPVRAYDPADWTPEEGLSGTLITEVAVSPDGSALAYSTMRAPFDGESNEWLQRLVVDGTDDDETHELGAGLEGASSPRWAPEGERIAFVATVAEGDLAGTRQVFGSAPDGTGTTRLTAAEGGVLAFDWSPDGEWIAYTSPEADEPEPGPGGPDDDAAVEGATPVRVHLWRAEPVKDAKAERLTDGDLVIEDWDWAPDATRIAFTHRQASEPESWRYDVGYLDVSTGETGTIAASSAAEMGPLYSPDGSTVALIRGDDPTADFSAWRVELVPAPGATGGTPKTLAATPNEMPTLVGWSADGTRILFEEAFRTTHIVGALPVDGAGPSILSDPTRHVEAVTLSRDGSVLGFASQSFDAPQEAFVAPASIEETLVPQRVSHENDDVLEMPVPKMEVLRWESSDGMGIEGILTYPLGYEEGRTYPLVLSVHGGPAEKFSETYFGQPDVYPYATWASRGYAVLRCNPRGSTGYGGDFRKANIADWDGMPYEDLMAGVDAAIELGVADPERLAVVGWSYGGHTTANITTKTDRFRSAVVGAGPVNLVSQAGTTDLPDMIPAYMDGYAWEIPEVYLRESPIFRAGSVKTPTLILHGDSDTRVPYSQAQEWHAALTARGVETELVAYPRAGHVVQEPQLMLDLQLRVLGWVEERMPAEAD